MPSWAVQCQLGQFSISSCCHPGTLLYSSLYFSVDNASSYYPFPMKCPAQERQGDRPCLFFLVFSPDTPLLLQLVILLPTCLYCLCHCVCVFVLKSLCLLQCACVKIYRQYFFLPNTCTVNRYILAWNFLFCLDAHYKLPFIHSYQEGHPFAWITQQGSPPVTLVTQGSQPGEVTSD